MDSKIKEKYAKLISDGSFGVEGANDFKYTSITSIANVDELIFLAIPTIVLLTALFHLMIDWFGLLSFIFQHFCGDRS